MQLSCNKAREILTAGAEKQSFISSHKVESPVLHWAATFFNKQPRLLIWSSQPLFKATEKILLRIRDNATQNSCHNHWQKVYAAI